MTGPPETFASLLRSRRGYIGLLDEDGVPEAIPVCFTWAGEVIWIAVDSKLRSQVAKAVVSDDEGPLINFTVDRWDEDWNRVQWLTASGPATVLALSDESTHAIEALASKYPHYRNSRTRPAIVRLDVARWEGWEPEQPT
jgi:hypothetical protein